MNRMWTAIFVIIVASRAFAQLQEQAHYVLKGNGDAVSPQVLHDQAGNAPDLQRQGSPQIITDAPTSRRQISDTSVRFDNPDQCYSVAKNLVSGDNFVVEVWVNASKENDPGWHTVVANGNGARGFLIAQHDNQWTVLVGGVGVVTLGDVYTNEWTHLAIVKSQGAVSGWLNGRRVCDLRNLGGGDANFSIGATSPNNESFSGCIAEVRYATFPPGQFDPARDFVGNPAPPHRPAVPIGPEPPAATHTLATQYATFGFDDKGFLLSITARQTGKQYCPGLHPSPVMSLHESGQPNDKLLAPTSARFDADKHVIELKYANGATAVVKAEAKETYVRLQLISLTPRGDVDNIVWGPLNTKIAGKIGDIIGVVRDADWAIGMYGLDDNTIAGPVEDGDCFSMGYYIHSPDPDKYPLPRKYEEGQWFNIGGDGVSDTAFFSHPEEYFQWIAGSGAKLNPQFGSTVTYHARDRRKSYVHHYSLLPGFTAFGPRHMVSDPIEGVDFMGSGVALYACPDDQGLSTIEKIIRAEGLPYITNLDGKWVRDPSAVQPTLNWSGPYDKAIEYAAAMGIKNISRETGGWYPSLGNNWVGNGAGMSSGPTMPGQQFMAEANKRGITYGGLHTLTVFLQGGISHDVTPTPSEHLQTVCRTKLARDISADDTTIIVTDPSFLAETGTWPSPNGNYLRIGGEMLTYTGISDSAPWTLQGVKRGHASKAVEHKAGDEVVKLMQNCYNGFVPDMKLLMDYAEYYADLMARNGMDNIGFDGFESMTYQNHGYYAFRVFCRRLYETYHQRTGKWPTITTTSNVFAGSWAYLASCNIGGGGHMFDIASGRRGIEGKDIGNAFTNSYFPGTFGRQGWYSGLSLYDAENLEAKSVGWNATYALDVSQGGLDHTGERDAIFKAFHAWEAARAAGVFTEDQKERLRDPKYKFHLEQIDDHRFRLTPIREVRMAGQASQPVAIFNDQQAQPLQFALRVPEAADGVVITLPDGGQIMLNQKIEKDQFIICKGDTVYLADNFRKKVTDLSLARPAVLPAGESRMSVTLTGGVAHFDLTVWVAGNTEEIK
ncbi:MAG: hypothetical protein GC162_16200 [Planctomycetes bacterium]|nr:hypothetical protein [Planctomycetota bacterium]